MQYKIGTCAGTLDCGGVLRVRVFPPGFRLGRSMGVLLTGILLFHAGWYLLLPYFAILFTARRSLTPAEAGLVLAAQSLALLLGSAAGGVLADRAGRKRTLLAGLVLRTVGIGALGFPGTMTYYLAAAAVAGFGGGLYGPAAKVAIAVLAGERERTTAFALRGVAANIGVSLGPLAGAFLVRGTMLQLFGLAAGVHLVLGVLTWALLDEPLSRRQVAPAAVLSLLSDVPYLVFSAVSGLTWALFTQLAISVPLFASRVLGLEASVGLLWTISSVVIILLQVIVTRRILAQLAPLTAMAIGALLIGAGLGLVGVAGPLWGFGGLVAAVLVFIVGEMFLMPTVDTAVSLVARPGAEGAYFGIASVAWGLGEGLGNLSGGGLMQYSLRTGRVGLPWASYAAVGVVVAGLFWGLSLWTPLRQRLGRSGGETVRRVQIFRPGHPVSQESSVPARLSPIVKNDKGNA